MIDPVAAVEAAAPVAQDPDFWVVLLAQHGGTAAIAAACLFVMYKLLQREQTARDTVQGELVATLKLQPAAIGRLESAITGLSSEVSGLRRTHETLQRGHDELRGRVDTHAARLDDHDRRIRAHEYDNPSPPTRRARPTPAAGQPVP